MKYAYAAIVAIALLVAGFYMINQSIYEEERADGPLSPVEITPIEHATFVLTWGDTVIYNDPTGGANAFADQPAPHIVLVTDIHSDHMDADTLTAVLADATLVTSQAVKEALPEALASRAQILGNGDSTEARGVKITAVPAYNLPESADAFHPKGRGNGYILEKEGFRVYIAGDTSGTPEVRALTGIDVAFVPMNLPFTMSVEEAASTVLDFKPKKVYPYHYRGQGGLSDVERFKTLVGEGDSGIEVLLLKWY